MSVTRQGFAKRIGLVPLASAQKTAGRGWGRISITDVLPAGFDVEVAATRH